MAPANWEGAAAVVAPAGSLPATRLQRSSASAELTVHLVGRLTPPVLGFLLPLLDTLHSAGRAQALVYVDGAGPPLPPERLPPGLRLLPVADHAHPLGRIVALYAALGRLAREQSIATLHLHGLLPGLAAMHWLYRRPRGQVHVYFSPHSSRALVRQTLLRRGLARLLQLGLGRHEARTIVNMNPELQTLQPLAALPASVLESPVPAVFFDAPRREARRPLLISCNLEGQRAAVDAFARIAVLLNDDALSLNFNWVGQAEPEAAAALKAAGVGQFAVASDESRAQRLGTAWIYVAPTEERGFPVRLAEAMAAGLPSVALDTPNHRCLLDEGVTGYLCTDLDGLLQRIAELVDSRALRESMGAAAREVARARFSEPVFKARLLDMVAAAEADGRPAP